MPEQESLMSRTLNKKRFSPWHILTIILIETLQIANQMGAVGKALHISKGISLGLFLLTSIAIIYLFVSIVRNSIKTEEDTAKFRPKHIPILIGIYFAIFAAQIILNIIVPGITQTENQTAIEQMLGMSGIMMLVNIIITGPMVEELVFRYYLMKEGSLLKLRILISCVLFIYLHSSTNLMNAIAYIPMTIGLTATRLHFRSVRFSYALHVIQNTTACAIIIFTQTM